MWCQEKGNQMMDKTSNAANSAKESCQEVLHILHISLCAWILNSCISFYCIRVGWTPNAGESTGSCWCDQRCYWHEQMKSKKYGTEEELASTSQNCFGGNNVAGHQATAIQIIVEPVVSFFDLGLQCMFSNFIYLSVHFDGSDKCLGCVSNIKSSPRRFLHWNSNRIRVNELFSAHFSFSIWEEGYFLLHGLKCFASIVEWHFFS